MTDLELAEEIGKACTEARADMFVSWLLERLIQDPFTRLKVKQDATTALAALRRGPEQWREVEPGHIFYAWLFEDGSFDWSLHAVEKYAREAADEEERTDPPDKIKVIPVRVVHAKPERPPSGEMVMVPRWSPAKLTIEKIVALRTSREWGLNFDVIANNPHFRTQISGRAICSCCDNAFTEIADLVPSYQVCRGCFDESTRMLSAAEASKEAK